MKDMYKTIKSPLQVQLELTHNCDSRCLHCYNSRLIGDYTGATITKEQIDIIVNELFTNEVHEVTVTGGEPLLHKENLYYLLEKLKNNNIIASLNSNLNLMDDKTAHNLKKYGIVSILTSCISYDSNVHDMVTQHKGSHKKMINGIKCAVSAGIPVAMNMVVSKYNENQIFKTGELAHTLGAKAFTATKAVPPVGCTEFKDKVVTNLVYILDELLKVKDAFGIDVDTLVCMPLCGLPNDSKYSIFTKRNCSAGVTSCIIGPDGQIRSCPNGFQTYGSIYDEGLKNVWLKMSDWRSGQYIPDTCKECSSLTHCNAGCRMNAYSVDGDLSDMDPLANTLNKQFDNLISNYKYTECNADDKLYISKSMNYREEEYGYIIFFDSYHPINVGKDAGDLLKVLSKRDSFTIRDVSKEYNIPIDNATSFFSSLLSSSVISNKQ